MIHVPEVDEKPRSRIAAQPDSRSLSAAAGHLHSAIHRQVGALPLAGAAAFTDVFHEHDGACLRIARRLVRDEGLAHDVVQDTFLAWWRTGGGGYRPERGELAPWLATLTRHKAVDALRTADRQRRLLAAVQSTRAWQPAVPLVDDVVWWEPGKQSLSEALPTLPPKQRRSRTSRTTPA